MKIVHIIPTFNEKENIMKMMDEIFSIGKNFPRWENFILVVDDFSPDGTSEIVNKYKVRNKKVFLLSKKKEGLGKALIMGYDYAINKMKADVVIPNDADFQWDPKDFPRLVKKIEEGYDVAVASRHIKGGKVLGWNWFRKLNHSISNYFLAWWVAGVTEVKDHAGNFKAIRVKGFLDRVNLKKMQNAGFSFQLHILYELSKTAAKFIEVPVTFKERRFGKSKIGFNKYYIRDVFEYIKSSIIIRADRSKRLIKYVIVGIFGFIVQTLVSKLLIFYGMNPGLAVSFGAECAILSNFRLNNRWTFKLHRITGWSRLFKFLQFNAVSVGSIFIQGFSVYAGTKMFGNDKWFLIMVLSIIFIVIPYSYFLYNRVIWKTHKKAL